MLLSHNLKRASRSVLQVAKSSNVSIQRQVANQAFFSNFSSYAASTQEEQMFSTPMYSSFSVRNMSMLPKNTLKTEVETTNRNFSALSDDVVQMLRAEFEVWNIVYNIDAWHTNLDEDQSSSNLPHLYHISLSISTTMEKSMRKN